LTFVQYCVLVWIRVKWTLHVIVGAEGEWGSSTIFMREGGAVGVSEQ
jgi:hypothetical protein